MGANQRTHDFTNPHWGHALHSMTWREAPERVETKGHLWWRREVGRYGRASVMVHCTPAPQIGDRLVFNGKRGPRNVGIVDVEPCGDPRDMFTLTLEFDRP